VESRFVKTIPGGPGAQLCNHSVSQTESCSLRLFGREMIFSREPSGSCGNRAACAHRAQVRALVGATILRGTLIAFLLGVSGGGIPGWTQTAAKGSPLILVADTPEQGNKSGTAQETDVPITADYAAWQGQSVRRISFEGVDASRLDPLTSHLAQAEDAPLEPDAMKTSLGQLFATGLYETIEVEASSMQDGVALVFRGTPRAFIGTASVDGAKGATINTQLDRASQLSPGTRFTPAKLSVAQDEMRRTLADNGFHEPQIAPTLTPHPQEQLVDIAFHVTSGPQSRIGNVQISGEPGMSAEEFRHYAHLRSGARVDHDSVSRALAGVLKHYRSRNRLEAEIKLESEQYAPDTKRTNFRFSASQGPQVKVRVQGVGMSQERIRHVIPIYEEGTVDEDLLMEGNRRLRDYYQRLGYFDVKVGHEQQSANAGQVEILYSVSLGPRRHVERVSVEGNHYFNSATLQALLSVHATDALDRHGSYSQALVSADVNALEAVYRNNGFSKVKVRPETSTPETGMADSALEASPKPGRSVSIRPLSHYRETAPLAVVYQIAEGEQQRVGSVRIEGANQVEEAKLTPLLNTAPGQLLSPQNLAGDRDALVTDYLSRGFEHPQVDITQQSDPSEPDKVDVVFHITEGRQVFVRDVHFTGLHYTRPATVARAVTIHAGDPLDRTALMDTQRNLYEFALFNQVDTAVENPAGDDSRKTVLLQAVEARRWALTYGFGFEAQTGTPQYNCGGIIASGAVCNPQGKTGVSPRVLADITRNNLFGREQSASLQGTYGLLEQKLDLLFQIPHFEGGRNFALNLSGGYANSLDVTTYVASRLEASMRLTEHFDSPKSIFSKANTLIYEFNFRRVKVQANSLQVAPSEIDLLATAVRVGGPALTWIRDTRDSALDAHRGTYTSLQEFLSDKLFGAQAVFNRLDVSNSSFWSFDKNRFVLARNTRYGQERAFSSPASKLIPLPERLYAGGATSLRGFSINAAGPRDPETGYPIGGAGALINSTEMRLPPPTLPFFGDSLSFVLFHDMGNIFTNASDAWASALRTRQPDRETCKTLPTSINPPPAPTGPTTSTGPQGLCSFNYFSHTLGAGLRYHTPAGPIRLDFSYNLNPPIFPVIYDYSLSTPLSFSEMHIGEASHFNFFFSLGQTF
jgi:outer membrane protein insertion porin family